MIRGISRTRLKWLSSSSSSRGIREISGEMEKFCVLIGMMVTWADTFIKTHHSVQLIVTYFRKGGPGRRGHMFQFSSAQSCPTLWNPMDYSSPGFPVCHQLLEPTQTQVHQVGDAIQPFPPLLSTSPPAFSLSQHQGLFQWVDSSCQVAKLLEFQLQHPSFQWKLRTDFL